MPHTRLKGESLDKVGIKDSRFLTGCYFEAGVSIQSQVFAGNRYNFIGAHSYMNNGGYMRDRILIGRYCSIGRRVTIGAGMHRVDGLSTYPGLNKGTSGQYSAEEREHLNITPKSKRRYTVIMNDVWIGDGAVIMPGIKVGTGSVIGANTVVTKDVEPYTIVGGVPGKSIRRRFPDDIVTELLKCQWWEMPHAELKEMPTGNVFHFLEAIGKFSSKPDYLETYFLS